MSSKPRWLYEGGPIDELLSGSPALLGYQCGKMAFGLLDGRGVFVDPDGERVIKNCCARNCGLRASVSLAWRYADDPVAPRIFAMIDHLDTFVVETELLLPLAEEERPANARDVAAWPELFAGPYGKAVLFLADTDRRYQLDLCSVNVMKRPGGQLVLNDPLGFQNVECTCDAKCPGAGSRAEIGRTGPRPSP